MPAVPGFMANIPPHAFFCFFGKSLANIHLHAFTPAGAVYGHVDSCGATVRTQYIRGTPPGQPYITTFQWREMGDPTLRRSPISRHRKVVIYGCLRAPFVLCRHAATWPLPLELHNIAVANIVWCMAYTRGVGGRSHTSQKSCNC